MKAARIRAALRLWPVALVAAATLAGALGATAVYRADHQISVGTIRLGVDVGHRGALDIYVPLVDWGARFPGVRMPARLKVEARTVESRAAGDVASGRVDVDHLHADARDAVTAYIRALVALSFAAAIALGTLVALALRGAHAYRMPALLASAASTAAVTAATFALLLPPRGSLENPEYYANGSQIPVALRVAQQATNSAQAISQDLDDQLVGLAKLISVPRERPTRAPLPRLTLASDLHNNVLALPALARAAAGRPLLFAGDLTTGGLPFEAELVSAVVRTGDPFVFVSGNHDSDTLSRSLAREGAMVLTERGRLLADGSRGPIVARVGGLRVAGYSDPFERRGASGYRAREDPQPSERQKQAFWAWLSPLVGRVDVVMVHSPALAHTALEHLRSDPPASPLALVVGHTHEQSLLDLGRVTVLNGGTIGGGGAGNFEKNQPFGLAVLTYEAAPFEPLAADLVRINPRDGSASAERQSLAQ